MQNKLTKHNQVIQQIQLLNKIQIVIKLQTHSQKNYVMYVEKALMDLKN